MIIAVILLGCYGLSWAAESAATTNDTAATPAEGDSKAAADSRLRAAEEQLAARYKRFEEVLLRMAELSAAEDPQRATLLRQAVARSNKRLIAVQFERLVELLSNERLSVAMTNQTDLTQDLKNLLELLLSEDRAKRLESEQARVRAYLKEVNKLIKEQQAVEAQTRRQTEGEQLSDRQGKLADRTGKLASDIENDSKQADEDKSDEGDPPTEDDDKAKNSPDDSKNKAEEPDSEQQKGKGSPADEAQDKSAGEESKSGDSKDSKQKPSESGQKSDQPSAEKAEGQGEGQQQAKSQEQKDDPEQSPPEAKPQDAAQQRLQKAQQRMQEAKQKLEQALREQAGDSQRQALEELEQAKADLERILRQMREEELSRVLAMLEARFRKMLAAQTEVNEASQRLSALPDGERGRSVEIESGRLSRKETQIAIEADKALALLREDASAVAMPEAVQQIRDDMVQVAARLEQLQVDQITIGVEQDILTSLEEILAALEKAQQELEEQKNNQQPPQTGEPQEPPLIDSIAELKMIRALQMRVNRRTETYSKLIEGEQTQKPDLIKALTELAERQERIYRTTRDIAVGKNQ